MTSKPHGPCCFCGKPGKYHLEDLVPLWVTRETRRLFPELSQTISSTQFTYTDNKVQHTHTKPVGSPSNVKIPIVCKKCNNEWMGDMERIAGSYLKPAIGDSPLTLDSDAQFAIATWMTLKALTYDLAEPNLRHVVEEDDLHTFYATKAPMPQFQVRLARYGEPHSGHLVFFGRRGFAYPETEEKIAGGFSYAQILTLVYGRLVIQSDYVPLANQSLPNVLTRDPTPYEVGIWPTETAVVDWPPLSLDKNMIGPYAGLPGPPEMFIGQVSPPKTNSPKNAPS